MPQAEQAAASLTTSCVVVGGGPGGAMLSLLLARAGVPVVLLEEHTDFDRDFRGDTLHPLVMENLDELGLAERLLQLPHARAPRLVADTPEGPFAPADFSRLKTRFPFVTLLPQVRFLEFITAEAQRYAQFQLIMGARAEQLIEEEGAVRGVRYRKNGAWHELRALLTVGADGRFSRVRRLAGIEPIKTSPPMDVLWFRLPRRPDDPQELQARFGRGHLMILLNRDDYWQVGYLIAKGSYKQLRAAGIEALRSSVAELAPQLADRVEQLRDWKQVALLSVESSRCPRWYRRGLLLIGDAAHVMSPVGGVGINYAIQDAVAAANLLVEPLRAGRLRLGDLRAVQRRREWPTRVIQAFQRLVQRAVLARALDSSGSFRVPAIARLLLRLPLVRDLPARLIAFGVRPVHVRLL
jgi:2-polyprenyl-6-methoxyphenol hydroxylase-like FAD-dependent oxidoreductase